MIRRAEEGNFLNGMRTTVSQDATKNRAVSATKRRKHLRIVTKKTSRETVSSQPNLRLLWARVLTRAFYAMLRHVDLAD